MISPDTFQAGALAWLAVISTVATAAIGAVMYLVPKVAGLVQAVQEAHDRLDRQGKRVDTALLNTPTPPAPAAGPTPVKLVNEDPIPVHETDKPN